MRRRIARFMFVFVLGFVAMVLGVVTSMTLTPPGRALLARTVSRVLDRIVNGHVDVGAISGSFLYDLTLEDLVVRDTSGALLADLPRVRVGFRLPNLLAGRVVLSGLQLDRPVIQLIKHRNGRMNYEEVLRLGKGKPGGTNPLVDFYDVRITNGTLRIALPWRPDTSLKTQARRDSALNAERAKPGRIIEESPEGLRRVILFSDMTTRMARLRITTPDRLPFTVDLDSLAARVNDPGVTIRDAVGRVRLHGDSAVFSLSRGALPDTRVSGGGAVTWPGGPILYDFQLTAPHVNLEDLRWVSPDFPSMTGSGVLAARSLSATRTEYDIRELHLRNGDQRIDGDLVAIVDKPRGLGFRDMQVTLRDLDLDAARAYVDSLPFFGTLSGTVAGAGFLDSMDVRLDWAFADERVPGHPVTTLVGRGGVGATRDSGLTFTRFTLERSNIDLRTARLVAPAVIIEGRLAATGTLDGPLANVFFQGSALHQDGDRPVSSLTGLVHLDTRSDSLGVVTDVALEPLSFEGIRRAFPSLKARGDVRGRFYGEGTLSRMIVNTELEGDIGNVTASGFMTMLPPRWGAQDLSLRFTRLDLAALTGRDLRTSLAGELKVTGSIDTLRAPEGELEVALTRSRVREWVIDSLFGRGGIRDSMIRVDTAYAEWKGASAAGAGTLGWASPHSGQMQFSLFADSLIGFDSLLLAATGMTRDTTPRPRGARRDRARDGPARGKPGHAGRLRRAGGRAPGVPAVPLAAGPRRLLLARRQAAPGDPFGRRGFDRGREVGRASDGGRDARLRGLAPVVAGQHRARQHAPGRLGAVVRARQHSAPHRRHAARGAAGAELPADGAGGDRAARFGAAQHQSGHAECVGRHRRHPGRGHHAVEATRDGWRSRSWVSTCMTCTTCSSAIPREYPATWGSTSR